MLCSSSGYSSSLLAWSPGLKSSNSPMDFKLCDNARQWFEDHLKLQLNKSGKKERSRENTIKDQGKLYLF